ncbi:unnamed protein product [Triticum turgidum subsp. durum]|uniref:Methyltransferase n=1 Tax=Triticum turgidum subsp. durum TaxID=4567 RepID=A0A9R0QW08_TRITD|nr:unnamed protein product [Triticum turgidum subsp. durum]
MKYSKEAKPERAGGGGGGARAVPVALMLLLLCGFSFYLGGMYSTGRTFTFSSTTTSIIPIVSTAKQEGSAIALAIARNGNGDDEVEFSECPADYQDYTPCTDPKRWRRYDWLRKDGDRFTFPGGGTMFPNGVGAYVDLMADLIPGMKDGSVRTALDTGCGVASWGGDLLARNILTVSLAPRDNHEAQVQFALERGIPAILGIISTQRLPIPSASMDMAHCSRCLIPWTEFGGLYLMEIQRVLRPGGFWVLSGPPINYENRWHGWNTTVEAQKADFDRLKKMLASMCFRLYNKKGDIAVWQKSLDAGCYDKLTPVTTPAKCDDSVDADAAWYVPMRSCVTAPSPKSRGKALPKWPQRLSVAPERVSVVPGGSGSAMKHDDGKWKAATKHYKALLPALGSDKVRNVMDMSTVYGGFAASLVKDPVWVMNVVSSYGPNSLGVVYDRGLIGTNHDWCEAFSTYPRTYDLLHADGLFTAESHRCEMKFVLVEMDRILRPTGYAIIRDNPYFLDSVASIAKGMRWTCDRHDTENKENEKEKLLICHKQLWSAKKA